MKKEGKRSICIRINSEESESLERFKEKTHTNDSDAIRLLISAADDINALINLCNMIGQNLVNIIELVKDLDDSETKNNIYRELEEMQCLLLN